MRYALFFAAIAGAFAAVVACGSGGIERLAPGDEIDAGGAVILPSADGAPSGQAGTGMVTGLPCDVQALLENRCIGCHDGKTTGAPRLLDYADLVAASQSVPTMTMAQVSVVRMQSGASKQMPPPPAAPAEADEVQTMQDWVSAGTPIAGSCTDPIVDAGLDGPEAGLVDAGGDAAPLCASGVLWTKGNTKSENMHPGLACNQCHSMMGGPNLHFAGTVYRGAHDIDDCNGAAPPPTLTITILDKNNNKISGAANAVGNFMINPPAGHGPPGSSSFAAPFRASVSDGTTTRSMVGSVTSGDCNSCHTADGKNAAPGRILTP